MTDHAAEQEMELEALQAIYMDDLIEVTDLPSGWKPSGKAYKVAIAPQEEAPDTEYPLRVELVFAHTSTYPDKPPLLKARGVQGLSDADVRQLQSMLDEQVEANLGMAMIYTLIGAAQEWLNEKSLSVGAAVVDPEAERKRREAEEEARIAELRRHGTPVTPEAFAEWKAKFDAEMALERSKLAGDEPTEKRTRLTGKLWFLHQEAQHLEVEEAVLGDDEEDGEDENAQFSDAEEEEEDIDYEEDDSEDEELLEQILASKGGGS